MTDFRDRLAAARAGDEAAFVELFRGVQPLLLRYLRTLGGPLADDAAAETWLNVVRGLDRFDGDEAGWRAWVLSIGRAKLRDAQRRAGRQPQPVDASEQLAGLAAVDDVPGQVEELMSTESALAIIGRLAPGQAEVVLLRHVVGLDVTQTARVLGKRPGAVRVTAHRALARLASMLRAGEPDDVLSDPARDPARNQSADPSKDRPHGPGSTTTRGVTPDGPGTVSW